MCRKLKKIPEKSIRICRVVGFIFSGRLVFVNSVTGNSAGGTGFPLIPDCLHIAGKINAMSAAELRLLLYSSIADGCLANL